MQRQITHPAGELPRCNCGRTPRHFIDHRAASASGGHFLECSPCELRTARAVDFATALRDWHRMTGQALPIPSTTTPRLRLHRVQS